jgi:hypothetical protein
MFVVFWVSDTVEVGWVYHIFEGSCVPDHIEVEPNSKFWHLRKTE